MGGDKWKSRCEDCTQSNTHQKEELEEEHEQVSRNSLVNCKKQEYQLWKCVKGERREKLFLVLLSPCSYWLQLDAWAGAGPAVLGGIGLHKPTAAEAEPNLFAPDSQEPSSACGVICSKGGFSAPFRQVCSYFSCIEFDVKLEGLSECQELFVLVIYCRSTREEQISCSAVVQQNLFLAKA